jgi:hypothetical protein
MEGNDSVTAALMGILEEMDTCDGEYDQLIAFLGWVGGHRGQICALATKIIMIITVMIAH